MFHGFLGENLQYFYVLELMVILPYLISRVTLMFSIFRQHLISVENGKTNVTSMSFDKLRPSNFYNFSVKYYCENNCFLTTKTSNTDITSTDTTTTVTTTTVRTTAVTTTTVTTTTVTPTTVTTTTVSKTTDATTTDTATTGTTIDISVAPTSTAPADTTASSVKFKRRKKFTRNSDNKNYNYVLVTSVLFFKLSELSSFSLAQQCAREKDEISLNS